MTELAAGLNNISGRIKMAPHSFFGSLPIRDTSIIGFRRLDVVRHSRSNVSQALVAEKATTTAGLVVSLTEGQDAGLLLRPLLLFLLLRQPGRLTLGLTLGHFFAAPSLISFCLAAFSPVYQLVLFGRLLLLFKGRGTLTFRRIIGSRYGRLRRQRRFSGRGKYDPHRRQGIGG